MFWFGKQLVCFEPVFLKCHQKYFWSPRYVYDCIGDLCAKRSWYNSESDCIKRRNRRTVNKFNVGFACETGASDRVKKCFGHQSLNRRDLHFQFTNAKTYSAGLQGAINLAKSTGETSFSAQGKIYSVDLSSGSGKIEACVYAKRKNVGPFEIESGPCMRVGPGKKMEVGYYATGTWTVVDNGVLAADITADADFQLGYNAESRTFTAGVEVGAAAEVRVAQIPVGNIEFKANPTLEINGDGVPNFGFNFDISACSPFGEKCKSDAGLRFLVL